MSTQVLIHCQESLTNSIKQLGLNVVNVDNNDGEITIQADNNDLDDQEFCEYLGLDYQQVNCVELAD